MHTLEPLAFHSCIIGRVGEYVLLSLEPPDWQWARGRCVFDLPPRHAGGDIFKILKPPNYPDHAADAGWRAHRENLADCRHLPCGLREGEIVVLRFPPQGQLGQEAEKATYLCTALVWALARPSLAKAKVKLSHLRGEPALWQIVLVMKNCIYAADRELGLPDAQLPEEWLSSRQSVPLKIGISKGDVYGDPHAVNLINAIPHQLEVVAAYVGGGIAPTEATVQRERAKTPYRSRTWGPGVRALTWFERLVAELQRAPLQEIQESLEHCARPLWRHLDQKYQGYDLFEIHATDIPNKVRGPSCNRHAVLRVIGIFPSSPSRSALR